MLFSELIVFYLFLGGLGGGLALAALAVGVLARLRPERFATFSRQLRAPSLMCAIAAVAVGCVCLMKDLTRPGEALLLFTQPTASAISFGTFSLAAFLLALIALLALELRARSAASRGETVTAQGCAGLASGIQSTLEALCALLALAVIVYTGVFLSSMQAVPLWATPLLPVLFTVSSLSSGAGALALIAALLSRGLPVNARALRPVLAADSVVIVLEGLALAAMFLALSSDDVASLSLARFVSGDLAGAFWAGFVACGIAVPLVLELAVSSRLSSHPVYLAALGCLILVGAFFLRYCIIHGGLHLSLFMFG